MTTSTPDSLPSSPAESPAVPDEFQCQNRCGNPWAVAIIRAGVSETDFLCDTCALAMWAAILQEAYNNGTLTLS